MKRVAAETPCSSCLILWRVGWVKGADDECAIHAWADRTGGDLHHFRRRKADGHCRHGCDDRIEIHDPVGAYRLDVADRGDGRHADEPDPRHWGGVARSPGRPVD